MSNILLLKVVFEEATKAGLKLNLGVEGALTKTGNFQPSVLGLTNMQWKNYDKKRKQNLSRFTEL